VALLGASYDAGLVCVCMDACMLAWVRVCLCCMGTRVCTQLVCVCCAHAWVSGLLQHSVVLFARGRALRHMHAHSSVACVRLVHAQEGRYDSGAASSPLVLQWKDAGCSKYPIDTAPDGSPLPHQVCRTVSGGSLIWAAGRVAAATGASQQVSPKLLTGHPGLQGICKVLHVALLQAARSQSAPYQLRNTRSVCGERIMVVEGVKEVAGT